MKKSILQIKKKTTYVPPIVVDTPGTYTFTPTVSGDYTIESIAGGGGSGYAIAGGRDTGSGGGGAGTYTKFNITLVAGTDYSYTVPDGGDPGVPGTGVVNGQPGDDLIFDGHILAVGGGGSVYANYAPPTPGAVGGNSSDPDWGGGIRLEIIAGGDGADGSATTNVPGGTNPMCVACTSGNGGDGVFGGPDPGSKPGFKGLPGRIIIHLI